MGMSWKVKRKEILKENKKVQRLMAKVNQAYAGNDEPLNYLKNTGQIYIDGKRYALTELGRDIAFYGVENVLNLKKGAYYQKSNK